MKYEIGGIHGQHGARKLSDVAMMLRFINMHPGGRRRIDT